MLIAMLFINSNCNNNCPQIPVTVPYCSYFPNNQPQPSVSCFVFTTLLLESTWYDQNWGGSHPSPLETAAPSFIKNCSWEWLFGKTAT